MLYEYFNVGVCSLTCLMHSYTVWSLFCSFANSPPALLFTAKLGRKQSRCIMLLINSVTMSIFVWSHISLTRDYGKDPLVPFVSCCHAVETSTGIPGRGTDLAKWFLAKKRYMKCREPPFSLITSYFPFI